MKTLLMVAVFLSPVVGVMVARAQPTYQMNGHTITIPSNWEGQVCAETFGQSLVCMSKQKFLTKLVEEPKSRKTPDSPIEIPLNAGDETIVYVSLPPRVFAQRTEMPVGTVYEFRRQAEENYTGLKRGYIFNTFIRP